MELNSSLYQCRVFHDRSKPKKNAFGYDIFMFMLDIDEVHKLAEKHLVFTTTTSLSKMEKIQKMFHCVRRWKNICKGMELHLIPKK